MAASDIAVVLGAVAVLVTALAGLVQSTRNGRAINNVHDLVKPIPHELHELQAQREFLEAVARGVREQEQRPRPHPVRPPQ